MEMEMDVDIIVLVRFHSSHADVLLVFKRCNAVNLKPYTVPNDFPENGVNHPQMVGLWHVVYNFNTPSTIY
jgi:hypothetical protein